MKKMLVTLTDGRSAGELLFYRAFSIKGERYSIFLDLENPPEGENYQPFVLKDEPDGLYSVPDNALMYSILNFLDDMLKGNTHFYTKYDLDIELTEL